MKTNNNIFLTQTSSISRINSIDFIRGLVMLLMTIDHSRALFSSVPIGNLLGVELPMTHYVTRWITHLCAPTFVFLSGISIFFRQYRYPISIGELQREIVKRALFIILLSTTVASVLWTWIERDPVFTVYNAELWALAFGMMFVALLIRLPIGGIAFISIFFIAVHNYFDRFDHSTSILWAILHVPQKFDAFNGAFVVYSIYPILPWLGIAGLGYVMAYHLFMDLVKGAKTALYISRRKKWSFILGFVFLAAFFYLRYSGVYGDKNIFINYGTVGKTLMSFFDVTKYPPSLLYTLITLSPAVFLLSLTDSEWFRVSWFAKIVAQYGKSALLYYLLHLAIIFLIGKLLALCFNDGMWVRTSHLWLSYLTALMTALILFPIMIRFTLFRNNYKDRYTILRYF